MSKTFKDIVVENFDEIQRNFRKGLKDKGYSYDEDLMNDAFISCIKTLKEKQLTEKEAIKYYWVAYVNKYKTRSMRDKKIVFQESLDEYDTIDDEYNKTIDKIYKIVIDAIRDKFGIRDAFVWELYVCQGRSAKDIRNMGFNIDNFVYLTRKIKRYIVNHLIPENKELQELIKYRKEA